MLQASRSGACDAIVASSRSGATRSASSLGPALSGVDLLQELQHDLLKRPDDNGGRAGIAVVEGVIWRLRIPRAMLNGCVAELDVVASRAPCQLPDAFGLSLWVGQYGLAAIDHVGRCRYPTGDPRRVRASAGQWIVRSSLSAAACGANASPLAPLAVGRVDESLRCMFDGRSSRRTTDATSLPDRRAAFTNVREVLQYIANDSPEELGYNGRCQTAKPRRLRATAEFRTSGRPPSRTRSRARSPVL